jgi:hypothetical protein
MGDNGSCQELDCAVMIHITQRITDLEKLLNERHNATLTALALAERTLSHRLETLNDWKNTTLNERKFLATAKEVEDLKVIMAALIKPLERFQDRFLGIIGIISLMSGAIGAIVAAVIVKWILR